jgi:ornithine cyclodeaminase
MRLITVDHVKEIAHHFGIESLLLQVIEALKQDFSRWPDFNKSPRHATHYPQGVMELMPCSDDKYYAYKFVNGHPANTLKGRLCVTALGMFAEVESGYPLLISEMTLLTAIRTAATTALSAKYLARENTRHLAIIGTGAQSEFQALATQAVLPIQTISYFDPDKQAMDKFQHHLQGKAELRPCGSILEAIKEADMIITATAQKKQSCLFGKGDIKAGTHISAIGGDCPGKTELPIDLLQACKIIVEYLPQSLMEGEIQNSPNSKVHAELWQLVNGDKTGRTNNQEITLFDSVGFALEDFSILKLIYTLSEQLNIGQEVNMIPTPANPKDLYSIINNQLPIA